MMRAPYTGHASRHPAFSLEGTVGPLQSRAGLKNSFEKNHAPSSQHFLPFLQAKEAFGRDKPVTLNPVNLKPLQSQ
jgi:hypothetical protein